MSTPAVTPIAEAISDVLWPDSILIDFESCSLQPDSALLSFGALAFNRHQVASVSHYANIPEMMININLDLTTQFLQGFDFDKDTAKWWREKNGHNIKGLYIDRVELIDMVTQLNTLLATVKKNCKDVAFFCRHPHADYVWLRTVCERLGVRNPISYNRIYDVATYVFSRTDNLRGVYELDTPRSSFHHAFNDCYRDALQVATVNERKILDV